MRVLKLFFSEIKDQYIRDNFRKIVEYLTGKAILQGEYRFYEIVIPSAVTNYKFAHNLGFVPKDVLQTSKTGAGTLTWNYTLFDRDNLDITTSGACTFRGYIGRHREDA